MNLFKSTFILCLMLIAIMAFTVSAQTYWPNDATKYPIQRGTHYGEGYVVGTNDAAVAGSIAIGGNDRTKKALVLDAADAGQVGEGTNTVDGSFKFHDNYLALVFHDATTNTDSGAYTAPMEGCLLIGQYFGSDEIWISTGSGTNWNRMGEATIVAGSLLGGDMNAALAGASMTLNGNALDVDEATSGTKGSIYLPNIVQSVKTDVEDITSGGNTNRYDIADLTVTITPKSTASKIRITATIIGEAGTDNHPVMLFLQRNGTDIGVGDSDGSKQQATSMLNENFNPRAVNSASIDYLDSPSTTSAITYKLQMASDSGVHMYINKSASEVDDDTCARYISSITAEEIYQ